MLLHAREGHVELLGQVRDRRLRATQLLEDAATGDVRQRGERGIEPGIRILNHLVQYLTTGFRGMQGRAISEKAEKTRNPWREQLLQGYQIVNYGITCDDARTLLAWREALGPSVPLTAPDTEVMFLARSAWLFRT